VQQVFDLPSARARFGRYLSITVQGDALPVQEVLALWPAVVRSTEEGDTVHGLKVRVRVRRQPASNEAAASTPPSQPTLGGEDFEAMGAEGELDLGDASRFWPAEEALTRWRALAHDGQATVVYEAATP
jgi:DNA polymerase-3 subunit alpha